MEAKDNIISAVDLHEEIREPVYQDTTVKDATFEIAEEALGNNLPPNYYVSPRFLGTVIVSSVDLKPLSCSTAYSFSHVV